MQNGERAEKMFQYFGTLTNYQGKTLQFGVTTCCHFIQTTRLLYPAGRDVKLIVDPLA
jgi:hypothetical protein